MAQPHVLISCGSFNPITVMHLRMFEVAKQFFKSKKNIDIQKGVISPTNDHYAAIKPTLIPSRHRVAMINLALKDVTGAWIVCDTWETRQQTWIRTLIALRHYESVYGSNMKLLCGADLIESFLVPNLWSDEHIEEILTSYNIVCVPRCGSNPWKIIHDSEKSHIFRKHLDCIHIIEDWAPTNISSTQIRTAVRENQSIDHLVNKDVAAYIKANNLYKY